MFGKFTIKALDDTGEELSSVSFSKNWSKGSTKEEILNCAIKRCFEEFKQKLIVEKELGFEI